jgi:hypothetical protein
LQILAREIITMTTSTLKLPILFGAVASLALSTVQAGEDDWVIVRPEDKKFTLRLPHKPREEKELVKGAVNDITRVTYRASVGKDGG